MAEGQNHIPAEAKKSWFAWGKKREPVAPANTPSVLTDHEGKVDGDQLKRFIDNRHDNANQLLVLESEKTKVEDAPTQERLEEIKDMSRALIEENQEIGSQPSVWEYDRLADQLAALNRLKLALKKPRNIDFSESPVPPGWKENFLKRQKIYEKEISEYNRVIAEIEDKIQQIGKKQEKLLSEGYDPKRENGEAIVTAGEVDENKKNADKANPLEQPLTSSSVQPISQAAQVKVMAWINSLK